MSTASSTIFSTRYDALMTRTPRRRDAALIDLFAAIGSQSELARRLGISRAAVSHWQRVPLRHLRAIEALSAIPRARLRPDLYAD
jgi:DNA invertase Pin-like site-specific DNA recombinase